MYLSNIFAYILSHPARSITLSDELIPYNFFKSLIFYMDNLIFSFSFDFYHIFIIS